MNNYGTFLYQMDPETTTRETGYDTAHALGTLALVAGAAALLFLPGWSKLLAVPLVYIGLGKKLAGAAF